MNFLFMGKKSPEANRKACKAYYEKNKERERAKARERWRAKHDENLVGARASYHKNKDQPERRASIIGFRTGRKEEIRELILSHKQANPCPCGEADPVVLQFHHRDPAEKEITIAFTVRNKWTLDRVQAEIAKCDVLCANCHLRLHHRWRQEKSCQTASSKTKS